MRWTTIIIFLAYCSGLATPQSKMFTTELVLIWLRSVPARVVTVVVRRSCGVIIGPPSTFDVGSSGPYHDLRIELCRTDTWRDYVPLSTNYTEQRSSPGQRSETSPHGKAIRLGYYVQHTDAHHLIQSALPHYRPILQHHRPMTPSLYILSRRRR